MTRAFHLLDGAGEPLKAGPPLENLWQGNRGLKSKFTGFPSDKPFLFYSWHPHIQLSANIFPRRDLNFIIRIKGYMGRGGLQSIRNQNLIVSPLQTVQAVARGGGVVGEPGRATDIV